MSVSNWMLVVGMLMTVGVLITFGFIVFAISLAKKLFAEIEKYTTLCVKMMNLIQEVEDTKKKTLKLYEDAQAEKKYDVVNGPNGPEIKLVPKVYEEVG